MCIASLGPGRQQALSALCAGMVMAALAAAPSHAADTPSSAEPPTATLKSGGQVRTISGLQAAALLMQAGRLDDAKTVLLALLKVQPNDSQTLFMLAMIDVQQKDYPAAIRLFRRILVREPGAVRVRLELARAFFLNKDYDNAERQFRFARAGDLPAAARANIDHYLYAIREARRWTSNLSISLAPDTDINAGPSGSTVDIYGLPFQLSDQTRQKSGVGVAVDAGEEWSVPLSQTVKLRLGGQIDSRDYPNGGAFDDTTLAGYVGPRFITPRWDVSPLFTAFRRWYGGQFYNQGVGGSVQTIFYAAPKLGLSLVAGGQQVTYGGPPGQGGPAISASAGFFYTLTPLSVVSGAVAMNRQNADLSAYANTALQLQLSYSRDLPHGYSISVQPSYVRIDYDAPLAAFGVARADRQWTIQLTLLNRRIDIAGFTPRLLYAYTHNASDISLYAYDRNRFEVGVTRTF